jgi:polar amino acid transport system substrate-binding protein
VPWKRALMMIEKGVADGLIGASYNDARARYAVYPMKDGKLDSSRRLNSGKTYYIYKNRKSTISWDGTRFSDPDGPVAAKAGYAVIEDLKKHKNIQIVTRSREELIIGDLIRGNISAYAAQGNEELAMKKIPNFNEMVVKEPKPIRRKDYFIIFSKFRYEKKKNEMEKLWSLLKE